MNRLQTKCLLGSTLAHGLLFVVIVACLAFTGTETPEIPTLTFVPPPDAVLTDGQSRGGNRNVVPPPPAPEPPQQQPQAQSAPPEPQPEPPKKVEPQPEPEQPKPEPELVKPEKAEPTISEKAKKKLDLKPIGQETSSTEKTGKKLTLKATVRTPGKSQSTNRNNNNSTAQNKAWRDLARNIGSSIGNIRDRANSSGTEVDMPGVGDTGMAFINYSQFVKAVYDQAWIDPEDVADENARVITEVVIARDGTILSSKVLDRSGIPALDKSVQRALDRVRMVRPFPEGSRDQQRRFRITFSLKAKRSIG